MDREGELRPKFNLASLSSSPIAKKIYMQNLNQKLFVCDSLFQTYIERGKLAQPKQKRCRVFVIHFTKKKKKCFSSKLCKGQNIQSHTFIYFPKHFFHRKCARGIYFHVFGGDINGGGASERREREIYFFIKWRERNIYRS